MKRLLSEKDLRRAHSGWLVEITAMIASTAQDLRNIIEKEIGESIHIHRHSKGSFGTEFEFSGPVSEEEVSYFIFHNILLDDDLVEQLVEDGFWPYSARNCRYEGDWLEDFRSKVREWSRSNSWLGADEPMRIFLRTEVPIESQIWQPKPSSVSPKWVEICPTYVLLALDLLKSNRLLCELNWRDFENLIGDLLVTEGWEVEVTQATRDGGIDVVGIKDDPILGKLKSVWQAKRYGASRKVKLHEVRELSGVVESVRATKGIIVTTSHLTKDAVEWVQRDTYRIGYKDGEDLARWLSNFGMG